MSGERYSKKIWLEIEDLLQDPDRNISRISRKFKVSRRSLYARAWKKGIMERKSNKAKNKGFWKKVIKFINLIRKS